MKSTSDSGESWLMPQKRAFSSLECIYVTMQDGTRIAVRLWVPKGAEGCPVGAVLECTPYRSADLTRVEGDRVGEQLASRGFAYARADVRGTGNSTGLLRDEYAEEQQHDTQELVRWLSEKKWCNGSVGIRGYSWGANVALQAATKNSSALKAVIACCPSVHRYATDAHWIGGALGFVNLHWGTLFKTTATYPPDPEIFGPKWREEWHGRLTQVPDIVARWTKNSRANEYWESGSVLRQLGLVKCAVYAVGGHRDGYTDVVLLLLEKLECPRKGLIGPWSHSFPQNGTPGPAVDWMKEEIRWWSEWLNEEYTGIMDEPVLQVYVEHETPSPTKNTLVTGQWLGVEEWPSPKLVDQMFYLSRDGLSQIPGADCKVSMNANNIVGLGWRDWMPFHLPDDLPRDQLDDDHYSICFDTSPLKSTVFILGKPTIKVRLHNAEPATILAVRLTEVTEDGCSRPLSYCVVKLSEIAGYKRSGTSDSDQIHEATLDLKFLARRVTCGSRLRLSFSRSLWPMVATSTHRDSITLELGESSQVAFPTLTGIDSTQSCSICELKNTLIDPDSDPDHYVTERISRGGAIRIERKIPMSKSMIPGVGTNASLAQTFLMEINESEPEEFHWSAEFISGLDRQDWNIEIRARSELHATKDDFLVKESLLALEAGKEVFSRTSEHSIVR